MSWRRENPFVRQSSSNSNIGGRSNSPFRGGTSSRTGYSTSNVFNQTRGSSHRTSDPFQRTPTR